MVQKTSEIDVASLPSVAPKSVSPRPKLTAASRGSATPLFKRWYVWVAVGTAVIGTSVLVATLTGPRGDFVPQSELGVTSTADWESF